ncbi:hypothetical protein K466DRAFT_603896 [Polyporus arcularius HHB13444]|uniref:Uncharacterized protein n=1 Tax=Polyporus arcularius HHB13444 TaxID=1314778 RepID=A0A5C3P8N9_9APHY|nr:hypothetical protein K466DRAFT_603896 [Polyporus arcularius HHB13444]
MSTPITELTLIWNIVNFKKTERRFVKPIKSSQAFGGSTAPDKIPGGAHACGTG